MELGQILTNLHQKPGQLRDMLGGGDVQSGGQAPESSPIGAMLASPMAKARARGHRGHAGQARRGSVMALALGEGNRRRAVALISETRR
jgi:hypothetical protein